MVLMVKSEALPLNHCTIWHSKGHIYVLHNLLQTNPSPAEVTMLLQGYETTTIRGPQDIATGGTRAARVSMPSETR